MTHAPVRLSALVLVALLSTAAFTGCAAPPEPEPTREAFGGGSSDIEDSSADESEAVTGSDTVLAQAVSDGMPPLPITTCPTLDTYEYTPTSGNTTWYLVFTCVTRDAFDATAAALVADGYEPDHLVISEGANISERNRLGADANGGYTEVQLNLVGEPDDLEFEIFITLTLP